MSSQTATLLAGVLFLLLAIIGGGFSAREFTFPSIPKWARVVSGILGLAFILLFILLTLSPTGSAPPSLGTKVIRSDTASDVTPQSIAFVKLEARAAHNPPLVNDVIQVKFSIRNAGNSPLKLDSGTFLSVRNPSGQNVFIPRQNADRTIQPNEVVETDASVVVSGPGAWELWPCYKLVDEQGGFCPSEWKSFIINVQ
jgi:hypothetical protein